MYMMCPLTYTRNRNISKITEKEGFSLLQQRILFIKSLENVGCEAGDAVQLGITLQ